MSMLHAKQHGNARCLVTQPCLSLDADSMRSVRQATRGENGVRSFAHVPSLAEMHTRQWIGTYAGRGNGDYRSELVSALRAITTYLRLFALTPQVALVRLDGQYGDAVAIAQLLDASVYFVTRARGYRVLEHPQIQGVLAHPPTASVTRVNSDEVVELFDGGWLQLDGELPQTRVIVARHRAPAPGKRIPVGKLVGEYVYELFITTLPIDGFLVEDVLDLYHGRGADRGRCSPMKIPKKTQIAGAPTCAVSALM